MKLKYIQLITAIGLSMPFSLFAQDTLDTLIDMEPVEKGKVTATFKAGNLINARTTETIHRNELDFRVDHRFGDLAGSAGGLKNFFGLDNASDIRIGFDYGLQDNLNIGIARAKGATEARQLYEANVKYRFVEQVTDNSIPVSVAFFGSVTASAVTASVDPASAISYGGFRDRLTYVSQLIIARKFSPAFSLSLLPTYVHRNYTAFGDQNAMFAVGAGGRLKVSSRMAIVADYFFPVRDKEKKSYIEGVRGGKFYNALGLGLELETGGHVFHLNFTNTTAVQESQFINGTTSSWGKGQFRWGFSIARRFSLTKDKD